MIQHRVFIANSTDTIISISDPTVQAILRNGDRVAYMYNDNIYYAVSEDQEDWYIADGNSSSREFVPEIDFESISIESDAGNMSSCFRIRSYQAGSSVCGWIRYQILDYNLLHKNIGTSNIYNNGQLYTFVFGINDSDTDIRQFEHVLAAIFLYRLKSINHNIDEIKPDIDTNAPIRKYNENNLFQYGVHLDQMHLVYAPGGLNASMEINPATFVDGPAFGSLEAGTYGFPIAKIVHSSSHICDIHRVKISAMKEGAYCTVDVIVTPDNFKVCSQTYNGCDDTDVYITRFKSGDVTTIVANVKLSGVPENDKWICNACIMGNDGSRFSDASSKTIHGVVGTSFDCFDNEMDMYTYSFGANVNKQERYKVDRIFKI